MHSFMLSSFIALLKNPGIQKASQVSKSIGVLFNSSFFYQEPIIVSLCLSGGFIRRNPEKNGWKAPVASSKAAIEGFAPHTCPLPEGKFWEPQRNDTLVDE